MGWTPPSGSSTAAWRSCGRSPRPKRGFDLVLANIIATVIIDLALPLKEALAPGGRLIASGIIAERNGVGIGGPPGGRPGDSRGDSRGRLADVGVHPWAAVASSWSPVPSRGTGLSCEDRSPISSATCSAWLVGTSSSFWTTLAPSTWPGSWNALEEEVVALVEDRREPAAEPRTRLTLYQALLKGDKMEMVLQKGTEIGVTRFVPVLGERSVCSPGGGRSGAEAAQVEGHRTGGRRAERPGDPP